MDNKNVFAANLRRYMEMNGKSRRDVSEAIGVSYYTLTDWVKGKKYPRMDKVEKLAAYFGILKSDLIEDKDEECIDEKPTTKQDDGLSEEKRQFNAILQECTDDEAKALLAMSQAFLANLRQGSSAPREKDSQKKQ